MNLHALQPVRHPFEPTQQRLRSLSIAFALALVATSALRAADPKPNEKPKPGPSLHGTIRDPLGARIPFARILLLNDKGALVSRAASGPSGEYALFVPSSGRYVLRVDALSFQTTTSPSAFYTSTADTQLDVTLDTPTLTQEITVTANGTPTPEAQVASAVTVLTAKDILHAPEIQEPLRLIPGIQVNQAGQIGGATGLDIRGAATDANKVLIDGVPANSIGGAVEFTNIAATGIGTVEVLREPDSALYGSDALAGVVSFTTPRGTTHLPLLTYSGDAGNFHTYRNEVTAAGAVRQFDFYSAFARLQTSNDIPNSEFHNATYAGNFGFTPNAANDLRFTYRHVDVGSGQPNAILFYGIPDTGQTEEQDNYYSAVYNNQITAKWHNQLRYGGLRQNGQFNSFGASGIFDPINQVYDGAPVTITGSNGYTASGQAVFQFSDQPSTFLSNTNRDFVYAQTDYHVTSHFFALGAFKYENESGFGYSQGGTPNPLSRGNYSYTAQLAGDLRNRLFFNLGTGLENNGLFGFAGTPRASLTYYVSRPSGAGLLSGTKLHGSFGKGIKEPGLFQQTSSLLETLNSNGLNSVAIQDRIGPIGAENSRTYDAGIDQQLFSGRIRLGATYFHDQFTNGVEFVAQSGLLQLGIPAANLTALQSGAYINSLAFRSQGLEIETESRITRRLFLRAGYTFTDAIVQHSFSSDNLAPSFNTAFNFPNTPIGAYSPLVGQRPFRIAPQTAYFAVNYTRSKFSGSLTGSLVGKRDDSTFLLDANFGSSLLLPNRDLDGSYQRLELDGSYRFNKTITTYARLQNLLDERYQESIGYPALPFTFRAGLTLSFGGESWRLK